MDWAEASTDPLRTEVEEISRTVADQQVAVGQLIAAYSELRRKPDYEPLLMLVRNIVEDALTRQQAALGEEIARVGRRVNEVAVEFSTLRRTYRDDKSIATAEQAELWSELSSALDRQHGETSETLREASGRLEEVLAKITALTAEQQAETASTTAAQADLRAEIHDALRQHRAETADILQANASSTIQKFEEIKDVVSHGSAAVIHKVREVHGDLHALVSQLEHSLLHSQDSDRHHREETRQLMAEGLNNLTSSIRDTVRAVQQTEDRITTRFEKAIARLQRSIREAKRTSERHLMQASQAEDERLRELKAGLADLREALQGTHALAAAQQEEIDLLDGAMSSLHESLLALETSLMTQQAEVREDLARQRRSSSALLKRQLRPIVESLPELVAAAVETNEEKTFQRIERAMLKLRRSLQHSEGADLSR